MKTTAVISLSLVLSALLVGGPRSPQNGDSPSSGCELVEKALQDVHHIKAGISRKAVEKLFPLVGGVNTRQQARYIYKKCGYIHIEIFFKPAPPANSHDDSPDDTVIRISKPYLAYPTID